MIFDVAFQLITNITTSIIIFTFIVIINLANIIVIIIANIINNLFSVPTRKARGIATTCWHNIDYLVKGQH